MICFSEDIFEEEIYIPIDFFYNELYEENLYDVIVVGELKGAESMAFLDAISTGHIGYATIHSNNSENTINRLSILMKN